MGIFILTDEAKKQAEELAAFARRPENLYTPGTSNWIPGDRPEFVRKFGAYRVVFTITKHPNGLCFRHMTISCPCKGRYPDPTVAFTIATLLGFTGGGTSSEGITSTPADEWILGLHPEENCAVIAQELEENDESASSTRVRDAWGRPREIRHGALRDAPWRNRTTITPRPRRSSLRNGRGSARRKRCCP